MIIKRIPKVSNDYEYRWSVDGNKFGTYLDIAKQDQFNDRNLVNDGWELVLAINGSIFYKYDGAYYAEGLEKSRGTVNQDWDTSCDNSMAIACMMDGTIKFDTQANIKKIIHNSDVYGALTGCFGVLKDNQNWKLGVKENDGQYTCKSGRVVLGENDNEWIVFGEYGQTGKSGYYGNQLHQIAKNYGCKNAICMDGGGSVFLKDGTNFLINTDGRGVKNSVMLYRKKKQGLKINQKLIGSDQFKVKSPHTMNPRYITIHNTANSASALEEYNYAFVNGGKTSSTGWHFAVDEKEIIQAISTDRNAWHAGDSKGTGNLESIGIEICRSTDYNTDYYYKAENLTIELVKHLMAKYNIPIENVVQHNHWSGKDCPHRIRKEGTWNNFIDRIKGDIVMTLEILKNGMTFRDSPNGKILKSNLAVGTKMKVLDLPKTKYKATLANDKNSYQWAKVELNGQIGYVQYDHIQSYVIMYL